MYLGGLLIGLLVIWLLGDLVLSWLDPSSGLNGIERASLNFLLGLGGLTLILFGLSFIYFPLKVPLVSLIIIGVHLIMKGKRYTQTWPKGLSAGKTLLAGWLRTIDLRKIVWLLILAIIMLKLTYSFVEASSKPEYTWDACAHWTYPGKVIYELDRRGMNDVPGLLAKFPGHICHYPKFIPLAHYWLFSWMGEANDQWSKIFIPLSLLCLVGFFYSSLRYSRGSLEALFFVWFLLSGPLFLYHSTFSYADLTSGIYFSVGVIAFYRWLKEKHDVYFSLFSVFLALTTWIKLEGRPLYLIGLAVLAVYLWFDRDKRSEEKLVKITRYIAAYAVIGLPWQVFMIINKMGDPYVLEPHYNQIVSLLKDLYGNLFVDGSWGVIWFGIVAALLFFFKNLLKPGNRSLGLFLLGFHLLIPLIYMSFDMFAWSGAAINRQWLNIYPVAVFTLGCITPRFKELQLIRKTVYKKES